MFCPICKSFISPNQYKCHGCGKILRKKSKNKKKSKGHVANSKKPKKNKKKVNKKNMKFFEIQKHRNLGGKTRKYNDRKNFEYEVLGSYIIW